MASYPFKSAIGLGVVGLLLTAGDAAAQAPKKATWFKDFAAAKDAARQSGKPIFLVFR
jgi:hypothetical protein